MADPSTHDPSLLCQQILADARRESEALVRAAREAGEALLARTAAEAEARRQEQLRQARAEAARRREVVLATAAVDINRYRAARLESLLDEVHSEARRRLTARDGYDYETTLGLLAAEAIRQMTGGAFIISLAPADRAAFGPTLADHIRARSDRPGVQLTFTEDPSFKDGGVVVRDSAGHQLWDNRLGARLDRLWPRLRLEVAAASGLVARDGSTPGGKP